MRAMFGVFLMMAFCEGTYAQQNIQFQSNGYGGGFSPPMQTGQPPMAGPIVPPNVEGWQHGWRETYTHEWRPLRDHDNSGWYQGQVRNDGAYMNNYGCLQREVPPMMTSPAYYQTQPIYSYPQQQYCVPQYQYVKPRSCWPW